MPKSLEIRLYVFKSESANFAHFANAFCKFKSKHTLIILKKRQTLTQTANSRFRCDTRGG